MQEILGLAKSLAYNDRAEELAEIASSEQFDHLVDMRALAQQATQVTSLHLPCY